LISTRRWPPHDAWRYPCDPYRCACLNRDTTIVLVFSEISKAQLIEARDAGVTEFIRKPLSAACSTAAQGRRGATARPFVTAPAYPARSPPARDGVNGPNRRKDPSRPSRLRFQVDFRQR